MDAGARITVPASRPCRRLDSASEIEIEAEPAHEGLAVFGFADLRMARPEKFLHCALIHVHPVDDLVSYERDRIAPFQRHVRAQRIVDCPMNRSSTCAKGWIQNNSTPLFARRAILTDKLVMVGRGARQGQELRQAPRDGWPRPSPGRSWRE